MILITGATGGLGSAAIRHLRENHPDLSVAALVRNPEKAAPLQELGVEIRQGDYSDVDSLVKAFQGVDKLLFVSANDIDVRAQQHRNIVEAIKKAKVPYVVYTSLSRVDGNATHLGPISETHIMTEELLAESGIPHTVLRNSLYMDALPMFFGENMLEQGSIFLPAGEGKGAYALRSDMAEGAARVLAGSGHEGKIYDFGSPTAWSFHDIADILTRLSGKTVTYANPSMEVYTDTLKQYGVPEMAIGLGAMFGQAIAHGELDKPTDDLRDILGRDPVPMEAFLAKAYGF